MLYLDKEQPERPGAKLVSEVGVRLPAHLTAVGRAILAALPEAQVRALYGSEEPLVRRTGRGPTSVNKLLRELAEVRRLGYAVDDAMVTPGIRCVAAPVFSYDGVAQAAIGVTFVAAQRSDAQLPAIAERVRETSARLSASMGYAERVA